MTTASGRWLGPCAVAVAVVAEVVAASFTHPFTWPGDLVTALALAGVLAAAVVQRRVPAASPWLGRRSAAGPHGRLGYGWAWAIWGVPIGAITAWELVAYFGAPRAAHPTLSSMLDVVTATPLGRGAAFAAWLALGWLAVTR